jgi:hypothetical protein
MYNNPHAQMQQESSFHAHLNAICNFLEQGFCWHKRAANQCRKFGVRGWGRLHDLQSECDAKELVCFEKILFDKIWFCPTYKGGYIADVNINSMEDFKAHHKQWLAREKEIVPAFNAAIHEARTVDIEIYKKLCSMLCKVQGEIMRVEMILKSLEFAGWNTHDVSVKSKWLHEQAEKGEVSGHDINANIG